MPGLKERAKTLIELVDGRALSVRRTAAGAGRQGGCGADARGTRAARSDGGGLDHSRAVERGDHRAGRAGLRRRQGRQARQRRPAAARGTDRPHHLPSDLRRPGGSGQSREPRPTATIRPCDRRTESCAGQCRRSARGPPAPPSCSAHLDRLPNIRTIPRGLDEAPAVPSRRRAWSAGRRNRGLDHEQQDRRFHQIRQPDAWQPELFVSDLRRDDRS